MDENLKRLSRLLIVVMVAAAYWLGRGSQPSPKSQATVRPVNPIAKSPAPSACELPSSPMSVIGIDSTGMTTAWFHQGRDGTVSIKSLENGNVTRVGEEKYRRVEGPFFPDKAESRCSSAWRDLGIDFEHCVEFNGSAPPIAVALRQDGKTDIFKGGRIIRTVETSRITGYLNRPVILPEPPLPIVSWLEGDLGRIEILEEMVPWKCTLDQPDPPDLFVPIVQPLGVMTACGRPREAVLVLELTVDVSTVRVFDVEKKEQLTWIELPSEFRLKALPLPETAPSNSAIPL